MVESVLDVWGAVDVLTRPTPKLVFHDVRLFSYFPLPCLARRLGWLHVFICVREKKRQTAGSAGRQKVGGVE